MIVALYLPNLATLDKIVRSPVAVNDLEAAYREMAKDEKGEAEALEWCEALAPDARDETR